MKKIIVDTSNLQIDWEPIYQIELENSLDPTPADIVNTIKGSNKILIGHREIYSQTLLDLYFELKDNGYINTIEKTKINRVLKHFSVNGILYIPGDIFSLRTFHRAVLTQELCITLL